MSGLKVFTNIITIITIITIIINIIKDSPSYFNNKSRSCDILIQGKFLSRIPFHYAKVGQCFEHSLLTEPPQWLLDIFIPLISRVCPSMQLKLDGNNPFFLAPLMTSMQTINVAKDGHQPDISSFNTPIHEDLSLHGKEFIGMSASRRKQYLANHDNLKKYTFDPSLIYTFDFYQHLFRFDSYKIKVGIIEVDINSFIGRNHINHMCVILPIENDHKITKDDIDSLPRVYDIEIIHSKCLTASTQKTSTGFFW